MAFNLSNIVSTRANKPPRMLIYGVPGIGKSTFGNALPDPVFIQTESGLDTIDAQSFPLAATYQDVKDQLGVLYTEEHQYKSVVIDTADAFERLIMKRVCDDHGVTSPEDIGYGKAWVFALNYWQEFLSCLDYLRDDKNMLVCLLCHATIKKFQSPLSDGYDRYEIALHKNPMALLIEWLDLLGFANYQIFTKSEEAGFNKSVTKALGTGERILHVAERPGYLAKNRYNLPDEMPFSWATLSQHLGENTNG